MAFLLLIALFGILVINLRLKGGDFFYPPVIQVGIWLLVIIFYLLWSDLFFPVGPEMLVLIGVSCILFSAGCTLTAGVGRRASHLFVRNEVLRRLSGIVRLFLLGSAVSVVLIALRATEIAGSSELSLAYFKLRNAINYGSPEEGYGRLRYLFLVPYFGVAAAAFSYILSGGRGSRVKLLLMLSLALLAALLSTSRTQLMMAFLLAVLPFAYFRRIRARGIIALLLVLIIPLALVMAAMLGKFELAGDSIQTTFATYIVAPTVAFSALLGTDVPDWSGERTFRFFNAVLAGAGFGSPPSSLIQEPAYVPLETNLYTSFQPYYLDFGVAGVATVQFLLGLFYGWLYRLVATREATLFRVFTFLIAVIPLLSIYSTETHLLQISLWSQLFFLGLVFLSLVPRVRMPPLILKQSS